MSVLVLIFVIFNITFTCTVGLENYDIVNTNRLQRHIIEPEKLPKNQNQNMQQVIGENDQAINEATPKVFHVKEKNSTLIPNINNSSKPSEINVNIIHKNKGLPNIPDSNSVLRGFYVFVGLSALILLYVAFRSYRLRRGGNRPTTVRKYGVLTQRTDIEMSPLQLDEDDEDDTVFEVGSHMNR